MRISLLNPATGRREPWKEILPADPAGVTSINWFFVTPDGGAYIYGFMRRLSNLYLVEGLK